MKQYISHKYTRGGNTLIAYLMDPKMEAPLRRPTWISSLKSATEFLECGP